MDVEAEKGLFEFVCPIAGVVHFHVGEELIAGQLLLTVEPSGAAADADDLADVPGWNAAGSWRPEWWRGYRR